MANAESSKYLNIARPYALAAFEYARDKHDIHAWKAFLESANIMVNQPAMRNLLENPEVLSEKLYTLFSEVLASTLNEERRNFLRLLAQNQRLNVLPTIYDVYNDYCRELEKVSQIRIETATPLSAELKQKFAHALSKRTQTEVTLQCELNPSILGGAIIHMGDHVIDGSVRGKLTRLGYTLCKSSN